MTHWQNRHTRKSQDGGQSNHHGMKKSSSCSEPGRYNYSNDSRPEDSDMPTKSMQHLGDDGNEHSSDPILERKSDSYGLVRVYPPAVDPKEWADRSFLLTTEYDEGKNPPGIAVKLKASAVFECFERPHFIDDRHKFSDTP